MSAARFFHVSPKGKLRQLTTREECLAALKADGFGWLDYVDPAREDLQALAEPLGLNSFAIEDCLDDDQIPKIEDYPTNTFVLFNRYGNQGEDLTVDEVDLALGRNFLVSVNRSAHEGARFFDKLDQAVSRDLEDVRKGPSFLLHVVLDYIVDRKFLAIESLQEQIDQAEEAVLRDPTSFRPEVLLRLRRHLLSLRKSIFHEREILVKICRRDSPFIDEKALFHFRDIYDHLAKFYEVTEMYREMISNLMEIYLSMVNNRMAQVGNRVNNSMRRLSFITTIFMPLTLLAGVGGMSEYSMMTGPQNWPVAYSLFLVAMVVIGLLNWALLRWVERREQAD